MEPVKKDQNQIQESNQGNQAVSGVLRFFVQDKDFIFVLKKTEALVSAIYMLTNFFEDHEPLKWKLRALGGELLTKSIILKENFANKREKLVGEVRTLILEITSLLLVAKQAGLISPMNYDLINGEFGKFTDLQALSAEPKESKHMILPEKFFAKEEMEVASKQPVVQNIIKDKIVVAKGQTAEKQPLKEFGAVAVKRNSRQSVIINLLKRKKEVMIKDISPLIEGFSEKTIQRELLAMVKAGILKKEGEKRWSRYSLAN